MSLFGDLAFLGLGTPASNAMQYVGGKAAGFAGFTAGTQNISLTDLSGGLASSPSNGDIIVVAYGVSSGADLTLTITDNAATDYTYLCDLYSDDNFDANLRVGYKIASSDTNLLLGPTSASSLAGAVAIHVWRPINATPIDVTTTTATGTNTSRANPPSITPVTPGAVIIACGCGGGSSGMTTGFTTSDLSNFVAALGDDDSADIAIGMGSYAWTSGAFDPAVFGSSTDNVDSSWCAATIALRPA